MKATAIQPSRTKQATGHIILEASKEELETDTSEPSVASPLFKTGEAAKPASTGTSTNSPAPKPANKKSAEGLSPRQELKKAIKDSSEVLYTANTVWPFTFFPNTVTVDRTKITICQRNFFMVSEVKTIRIEDVLEIRSTAGPLFGSIQISIRVFDNDQEKPYKVDYFWRNDAIKLKRVIQGYAIALQREIDCSSLPTKELANMLHSLGKDHPSPA
jgi:hypothetical protein